MYPFKFDAITLLVHPFKNHQKAIYFTLFYIYIYYIYTYSLANYFFKRVAGLYLNYFKIMSSLKLGQL